MPYLYPQAHDEIIKFLLYVAFSRTRNLAHACEHFFGHEGTFAKSIRQKTSQQPSLPDVVVLRIADPNRMTQIECTKVFLRLRLPSRGVTSNTSLFAKGSRYRSGVQLDTSRRYITSCVVHGELRMCDIQSCRYFCTVTTNLQASSPQPFFLTNKVM